MKYESPVYADGIGKARQTVFGGLNHNRGAGDGQIYEMLNLSSDYYPLLATRPKRYETLAYNFYHAIYGGDYLFRISGGASSPTATIQYGDKTLTGALDNPGLYGKKYVAAINKDIIILPDKKIYHTETNTISRMGAEVDTSGGNGRALCPTSASTALEVGIGRDVTFTFVKETKEITIRLRTSTNTTIEGRRLTVSTTGPWNGVKIAVTSAENVYAYDSSSDSMTYSYTRIEGTVLNMEDGPETDSRRPSVVSITKETPAEATFTTDSISWTNADFSQFSVGDHIQISGCSTEENNGNFTVGAISGNSMQFSDATFTAGTDTGLSLLLENRTLPPLIFKDGTLYGESAEENTIYWEGADFTQFFKAGDAIEISGCSIAENNKTIIVREVTAEELRFYEYSFTNGTDTSRVTFFKRNVPDLKFAFECDNRLWGSDGKTIYASKLGDPTNWYVYDGLETDSWAVDTGGFGEVVSGIAYQGYPTFMKAGDLYKIYGSAPSNFELIRVANIGCAPGSEKSLAIAGETLFYHHYNGIYAYAGGSPTLASQALGTRRYRNAVAGSDGLKYYVAMQDSQDAWHMFVYDTQRGTWHEEEAGRTSEFAYCNGTLYYIHERSQIIATGNTDFPPSENGFTEESSFDWFVEFTDFTDESPNKKGIQKFMIRMELDEDASDPPEVTVKLMLDSSGEWIIPEGGVIEEPEKRSYILPIIPQRADHYRLRIEGHGGCRIYSITREYYEGSELKSRAGRQ